MTIKIPHIKQIYHCHAHEITVYQTISEHIYALTVLVHGCCQPTSKLEVGGQLNPDFYKPQHPLQCLLCFLTGFTSKVILQTHPIYRF